MTPFSLLSAIPLLSLYSLSLSNTFMLWCALEVMTLSLVLSLASYKTVFLSTPLETWLKFTLLQCLSASVVLMSLTVGWSVLLTAAAVFKMGLFPFSSWWVNILVHFDLLGFYIFSIFMKIPLLVVMSSIETSNMLLSGIYAISVISVLIGGLGGLNTTNWMLMLIWSSIMHSGWLVILIFISVEATLVYMLLYSLLLGLVLQILNYSNSYGKNVQMNTNKEKASSIKVYSAIIMMSGIPPTLSFFMKWLGVSLISSLSSFLASVILLISILSTWWYLMWAYQSVLVW